MTSSFDAGPPDHWFTPPGTLRISAAALALAKRFHAEAGQAAPEEDAAVREDQMVLFLIHLRDRLRQ